MTNSRQPANIKVCPECGTNLIPTAKQCAVCGYRFTKEGPELSKGKLGARQQRRLVPDLISLPLLSGLVLLVLFVIGLAFFAIKASERRQALLAAEQSTAAYIATTYRSPTPAPTATFTPVPPTETPIVNIEYEVAPGDSCLSIAKRFNLYLDSLLLVNDIDCANLQIGTVLSIPPLTPTPEPSSTSDRTAAP
jgi:LysM repeat protein